VPELRAVGTSGRNGSRCHKGNVRAGLAQHRNTAPKALQDWLVYRDMQLDNNSLDASPEHYRASTITGVMHQKGGLPLEKGAEYCILYGEMQGEVAQLVDIVMVSKHELKITLEGRVRSTGVQFEECIDVKRNRFGQIVFPIRRVE